MTLETGRIRAVPTPCRWRAPKSLPGSRPDLATFRGDSLTSKMRPNNVFLLELFLASLFCIRREILAYVPGGRSGD